MTLQYNTVSCWVVMLWSPTADYHENPLQINDLNIYIQSSLCAAETQSLNDDCWKWNSVVEPNILRLYS